MFPNTFRFAQYRFMLRAETPIELSFYKGSALRGAFGTVFKRTACLQPPDHPRECEICTLRSECAYGTVFENALAPGVEPLSGYGGIPHPFVLRPPLDQRKVYFEGEPLIFDLLLIGRAIPMLPYFLYSFSELGKIGLGKRRGRFVLDSVFGVDAITGKTRLIYTDGGSVQDWDGTIGGGELQSCVEKWREQLSNASVRVEFITPTRIISGGQIADTLEFSVLVRSLLRRISGLCYFHCNQRWEADFGGLVERARGIESQPIDLRWSDWRRYSSRQTRHVPMGGVVGQIEYCGAIEFFVPYLVLGSFLHVGKSTTFGNGRYRLQPTDDR